MSEPDQQPRLLRASVSPCDGLLRLKQTSLHSSALSAPFHDALTFCVLEFGL